MRFLRGVLFVVVGLVAGGAAAAGVVTTCFAVTQQRPPEWTGIPGLAVLGLGPLAGGVAGLVVALRTGRKPPGPPVSGGPPPTA